MISETETFFKCHTRKKCVADTKKYTAVPAILLTFYMGLTRDLCDFYPDCIRLLNTLILGFYPALNQILSGLI